MEGKQFDRAAASILVGDFLSRYDADPLRSFWAARPSRSARTPTSPGRDSSRRNNDELVATWGNLVKRTLDDRATATWAVPKPGEFDGRPRDERSRAASRRSSSGSTSSTSPAALERRGSSSAARTSTSPTRSRGSSRRTMRTPPSSTALRSSTRCRRPPVRRGSRCSRTLLGRRHRRPAIPRGRYGQPRTTSHWRLACRALGRHRRRQPASKPRTAVPRPASSRLGGAATAA